MNESSQRNNDGSAPEQLERSAERIRADLDRTLDALERRLSPSQLLDRSLNYLREHGGELTHTVGEAARRNPVPIMLAVAGIGWLVVATARTRNDAHVIDVEDAVMDTPSLDDEFGDDEAPYAQPQTARGKLRQGMATARDRTRRAQDRALSVVEERPLLFGGLAVALGALLGAIMPATQYEDRVVGRVRDRAVNRAREMGERQYQNLRSRLDTHQDVEVSGRAH